MSNDSGSFMTHQNAYQNNRTGTNIKTEIRFLM